MTVKPFTEVQMVRRVPNRSMMSGAPSRRFLLMVRCTRKKSKTPAHVVLQVSSPELPSKKLIHYFQNPCQELMTPGEAKATIEKGKKVLVSWHTAYGDEAAIDHYEIWCDGVKVENIPFTPQTIKTPHTLTDKFAKTMPKQYVVKVIDKMNKVAETIPLSA